MNLISEAHNKVKSMKLHTRAHSKYVVHNMTAPLTLLFCSRCYCYGDADHSHGDFNHHSDTEKSVELQLWSGGMNKER